MGSDVESEPTGGAEPPTIISSSSSAAAAGDEHNSSRTKQPTTVLLVENSRTENNNEVSSSVSKASQQRTKTKASSSPAAKKVNHSNSATSNNNHINVNSARPRSTPSPLPALKLASSVSSANSASSSERVKVVVRCRPLSEKEEAQGHTSIVNVNLVKNEVEVHRPNPSSINLINTKSNKIFTFDSVYDESISQSQLYDDAFRPIIDSVLQGFNGTIFAYGQTGTGKTYTMEGIRDQEEHHGVIPNAFKQIFQQIQNSPNIKYLVNASYLEIYQEEIRDLLSPKKLCRELKERESGVYVKDIASYLCSNFKEINRLMTRGNKIRSVGATNMNEHSSRSHAIFVITIEASEVRADGRTHFRVGKLNLVDLAGSERQGKSGAEGDRLKEAVKINLSLSALGNVIGALVDGKYGHIPYRESKLTRLLQDSLGGNSKTVMVATIGPASFNYDETMTTLRYASRAKRIKNKPKVNEDPKDAMLREYQNEIAKLKAQLELKRGAGGGGGLSSVSSMDSLASSASSSRPQTSKKRRSARARTPAAAAADKSSSDLQIVELDPESQRNHELELLLEPYGISSVGLEPKEIVKLLEERRIELLRNNELVQEEKDKLLAKLDEAKTKIQYSDAECNKLVERIQWFESKVLNGGKDLLDYTNEQRKLLQLREKELKEQKDRQEDILRKIEEHDLSGSEINEIIKKLESEIEVNELKSGRLTTKLERIQESMAKKQENHASERLQFATCRKELDREIRLKNLIIDNFIPPSTKDAIDQLIGYDNDSTSFYTLAASSILVPRPPVDRMILQPLLKRNDGVELRESVSNVYFTDENLLQLQPIQVKPNAKIYVPPVLDPHICVLLKRAFADAEKDLVIDCSSKSSSRRGGDGDGRRSVVGLNFRSRSSSARTSILLGEPIILGNQQPVQAIITNKPVIFNEVQVQDFIVVSDSSTTSNHKLYSSASASARNKARASASTNSASTTSSTATATASGSFKSARSFEEAHQMRAAAVGKNLRLLRPGSAKGKMPTKF